MARDRLRTTIILGAGASAHCELPTAWGLRESVTQGVSPPRVGLRSEDPIMQQILASQFNDLPGELENSGWSSIDRFLEKRSEFVRNGKIAIATKLVPLEELALRKRLICGDWYAWLFEAIDGGVAGWNAAGLEVVTFNYDRSLELGLAHMIASTEGCSLEHAWGEVAALPFHHVYGSLGNQVYFVSNRELKLDCSAHGVVTGAQGIRIMSDERDDGDEVLARCRRAVLSAERLIFLGFGFDLLNLKRIGIAPEEMDWSHYPLKEAYSTAYGLKRQQRAAIEACLCRPVEVGGDRDTCRDFLRDAVRW